MTTSLVKLNAPVVPDQAAIQQAYKELDLNPIGQNAEDLAIQLDLIAKTHVIQARKHIYTLGPLLVIVRDRQLYSHHPEHFTSFKEWLNQPELAISESFAHDIINWWKYAMPALRRAGMDPVDVVDTVDLAKLRLLVSPIKKAADSGTPLSDLDIQDLVITAQGLTWKELERHIHPTSVHISPEDNPDYVAEIDEPDPEIKFKVILSEDVYTIIATKLSDKDMAFIDRRICPLWVDSNGAILRLQKDL